MDPLQIPMPIIRNNMRKLFLITGLDPLNDRFHAEIAGAFLQNNDSTAKYELLSPSHQIFVKTEKATLKPNIGILRLAWIDKYISRRPAVILIFIDIEWDDPNFAEKKTECESKINSLRQTISCSEVKFLLVLIQKRISAASPSHNDRVSELCSICSLTKGQIVSLAVSEGVKPHIVAAIKKTVNDFSQLFYQAIHKKIRNRRVPENHPNLLIRNQFKLGFISELRNDLASALNFYKLAFEKYSEAKIADENKFEYLSVVSLINYKISEVYFHRGNAIEAVTQFNRHEDKFMNKNKFNPGFYPSESLAQIEYARWCMKEYAIFGNLFVETSNAVVLNTSVNPGKYFNLAGEFSEHANGLIEKLKWQLPPETMKISIDILTPKSPLEYIGQRPWRPNVSLTDSGSEHHARLALEKAVYTDYEQSINHFKRALVYLRKIERCNRQIIVAELQLALVLAKQKNFEASLAIAEVVFRMMRDGSGLYPSIFVLLYELYLAFNDPVKFIQIILMMMNEEFIQSNVARQIFGSSDDCQAHFLVCFNNVSHQKVPPLLPNVLTMMNQQEKNNMILRWQQSLNHVSKVNMTLFDSVVSARGYIYSSSHKNKDFLQNMITSPPETISNESDAVCEARIQNKFAEPLPINKAKFIFEIFSSTVTPQNPIEFFIHTTKEFVLRPNDYVLFAFPMKAIPAKFNSGCEVIFSVIELYVGHDFCLSFDNRHYNLPKILKSQTKLRETIRVIRSEYPLNFSRNITGANDQILLKGEIAMLTFALENKGSLAFSGINLKFSSNDPEIQFFTDKGQNVTILEVTTNDILNADGKVSIIARILCTESGEKSFGVDLTAVMGTIDPCQFNKRYSIVFNVCEPFKHELKAINNEGNVVNHFLEGEDTFLEMTISALSECTLTGYEFCMASCLNGNCVENTETVLKFNDSFLLSTLSSFNTSPHVPEISIGRVNIHWKREVSLQEVTTTYDLGLIKVIKCPISLSVDIGETDHIIHKAIYITFTFTNLLNVPITLKFTVLRSDVFMFAGTNEVSVTFEPYQTQHKKFAFVANVAGELSFPKVQLESPEEYNHVIENYVLKTLPKTILVLPASKTEPPNISKFE